MKRSTASPSAPEGGDPWVAFGYLVAGVALYGLLGWGLSIWLNADYWIPIGILVGAGFGMYLVFSQTLLRGQDAGGASSHDSIDDDAAQTKRPASDDRGETA
jgi:hypothetical protein